MNRDKYIEYLYKGNEDMRGITDPVRLGGALCDRVHMQDFGIPLDYHGLARKLATDMLDICIDWTWPTMLSIYKSRCMEALMENEIKANDDLSASVCGIPVMYRPGQRSEARDAYESSLWFWQVPDREYGTKQTVYANDVYAMYPHVKVWCNKDCAVATTEFLMKHELMEQLTFNGARPFDPHYYEEHLR
jgi:hypothetical protein